MQTGELKDSLLAIWKAGVRAVLPDKLVQSLFETALSEDGSVSITLRGETFQLPPGGRVIIVGMGKASGKMAAGAESALAPLADWGRLFGSVNVPADALIPLKSVTLHPGRPAGLNEPTAAGVEGCRKMLALIESARPDDLVLALISGGGSALAPLPIPEITLEEKALVTRLLSGAGANIEELNCVRKQLSLIKGGGMRRLCRGKRLVSLILSDVLGDPLDVIACGATVVNSTTAADAWEVMKKFKLTELPELANLCAALQKKGAETFSPDTETGYEDHRNIIIANNRTAVDAAVQEAERLGFRAFGTGALKSEGDVADVAAELIHVFQNGGTSPAAFVSGGEPTVTLAPPERRGKGGRNTQLVLTLLREALKNRSLFPKRFAFLSGGTDGEDGPTDAAGAFFDDSFLEEYARRGMEGTAAVEDALERNDSYTFFEKAGGLLRTGGTGTNVCDLRVFLWESFCTET